MYLPMSYRNQVNGYPSNKLNQFFRAWVKGREDMPILGEPLESVLNTSPQSEMLNLSILFVQFISKYPEGL